MVSSESERIKLFDYNRIKISSKDFKRLSDFVIKEYGIKLPPAKKLMIQSRLIKRLKVLNIDNFSEYIEYVFSKTGQDEEVIHMIDVISTNKTDFFRESAHFSYLSDNALPLIYTDKVKSCKIWSAGCSSGEEPYSIAITLSEFAKIHADFSYSITATDISSQMLKTAINAVYNEDKIDTFPYDIKKKYFLRSKNREAKKVRVITDLRNKISFQRLNLNDNYYNHSIQYDIIFCRNVLIYFDRSNQEKIISKLCNHLKVTGFLFLGHSESITGFNLPLVHIQPTIFRKI